MSPEEPLTLETHDGVRVPALVRRSPDARRGVVLCHPHPDYGGSMHVAVLDALSDAFGREGLSTLRFDFRRPGTVEERLRDLAAAIDAIGPPVVLVGWSYGADLALVTGASDERVDGVIAIAPPLRVPEAAQVLGDGAVFLVPEHDQFNPPERLRARLPRARVEVIEGADHFLAGFENHVAGRVADIERELTS